MPIVNGKKIPFDPRVIAEYIHYGHEVLPDVTDAEDGYQQQERIRTESDMIWKAIEQYFPDTYKKMIEPKSYKPQNMLASLGSSGKFNNKLLG